MKVKKAIAVLVIIMAVVSAFAQVPATKRGGAVSLDSLRKAEESRKDSITYSARHIRYTTAELLKDSTQIFSIDTALHNFQNYNPISQPQNPTMNLGSVGLPYRDMLFSPSKAIGFHSGFHALDRYRLTIDSVRYYRAQSPYTELYYIDGGEKNELFRVTHTQNISPLWNIGGTYNRIGGKGFYANQNVDHLNASVFTWFETRNKRYMLLAATAINNIKVAENGSVSNTSLFYLPGEGASILEPVRLEGVGQNMPRQHWKDEAYFIKQFYYLGKRDSVSAGTKLLPRQRISYALYYTDNYYRFFRNEIDAYGAFPVITGSASLTTTDDRTHVTRWGHDLAYSFYLRGKSIGFVKNEVKVDVGVQYDQYDYRQGAYQIDFSNTTLKASSGYRFSDRVSLQVDLKQIIQGRQAGDFLYDAKAKFLFSKASGQITLGAYSQNKSPEQMFQRVDYQFHNWDLNFDKTKVNNFSLLYENPKYKLNAKAETFLINNYLFYQETANPRQIIPTQTSEDIHLLKLSVSKHFKLGRFHLDSYWAYQHSAKLDLLCTPALYTYNSLYYEFRLLKVLLTNIGTDMRFNTPYQAPSYALNVGQFYNNTAPVSFGTFPVFDVWVRGNLKRINFFFKYEYINQAGPFPDGYYTVNQYPMADSAFKMGISWKFYN